MGKGPSASVYRDPLEELHANASLWLSAHWASLTDWLPLACEESNQGQLLVSAFMTLNWTVLPNAATSWTPWRLMCGSHKSCVAQISLTFLIDLTLLRGVVGLRYSILSRTVALLYLVYHVGRLDTWDPFLLVFFQTSMGSWSPEREERVGISYD